MNKELVIHLVIGAAAVGTLYWLWTKNRATTGGTRHKRRYGADPRRRVTGSNRHVNLVWHHRQWRRLRHELLLNMKTQTVIALGILAALGLGAYYLYTKSQTQTNTTTVGVPHRQWRADGDDPHQHARRSGAGSLFSGISQRHRRCVQRRIQRERLAGLRGGFLFRGPNESICRTGLRPNG